MASKLLDLGQLSENFCAIVNGRPDEDVFDIGRDEVIALLKKNGAVLFSGFETSLDDFNRFAASISDDFMTYRGGGYIRSKVEKSEDATLLSTRYDYGREKQDTFGLPLHGEMYYVDNRPVILWFYCSRPAAADGETTVCDGAAVYRMLDQRWKDLLEAQPLKYIRKYLDGEWQKIYQTEDLDEAVRFCEGNGLTVRFDPSDKTFSTEYLIPAVIKSRWGGHKSYINNILPVVWQENMGRKTSIVRFQDGSKIPQELIEDVVRIQQDLIHDIHWKRGDFVVLDNTRTAHGRRAFEDVHRDVFLRMVRSVPF